MARGLIIFGNGLGRSLDNDFFSLDRALNEAWADERVLPENQRALILRCLPAQVVENEGAPTSEDELDLLQRTLAACDFINGLEEETAEGWLTEDGRAFPAAIRSYLHRTACEFHFGEHRLPEEFSDSLINHVTASKTHIATLNYDKLLYEAFVGTDVFHGFNCLIDGFIRGKFDEANLNRINTRRTGYYLHLHGSPLYFEPEDGVIRKASIAQVDLLAGDNSGHIVLTSVKHKTAVITASPLLRCYWKMLDRAISEAETITLFGYGGFDTHLNRKLSDADLRDKNVRIIERASNEPLEQRIEFWTSRVGACTVMPQDNILDFRDW